MKVQSFFLSHLIRGRIYTYELRIKRLKKDDSKGYNNNIHTPGISFRKQSSEKY